MPDKNPNANPDQNEQEHCSDLEAQVAARAAAIEAKVADKLPPAPAEQKPDNGFILDCLSRNRVGDAALFCSLFRGKYIFVQEWEKFLYWTGQYWAVDMRSMRALADAERVCKAYMDAWAQSNDQEGSPLHKLLKKHVNALRSQRGRKEMLECVTTIDDAPVISAEQLDCQPYLLATPTGVVDLRTGECSPGKPEQFLTSPCPTPWTGLDTPCPNFREYLLTCMADDQEMADFIVRLLGYGLLGEKNLHIWAIMYGPLSRNGKDTLMNVIKRVLGKKLHIRFPVNMLVEQKFQRDSSQPQADLMALRGAKIAYASEANSRQALDQAKIKDLTGGGFITARGLTDREMTEWKQSALLLLLTNYLPKLDASDDGFNARTICIEWPVKFVPNPTKEWERQIDYNMSKKLEAEDSGILALLVRGCMDVIANGLQIPEKVKQFTREQIDSFDDIGKFLKECCEMEDPPTGGREYSTRTAASDLLKICNWWCKKILGNAFPYTPKKFTPALEKKGIPTKKSSVMFYLGVTVKQEIRDEFDEDMATAESKGRSKL
ncbi:MAG: DNA primase [Desulfovibrio sp.]|nr:DNA primase [Desulfovibrio sp.]